MKRTITLFDKECLSSLIRRMTANFSEISPEAERLQEVLDSAEIIAQVTDDVITLDSIAVLRSTLSRGKHIYSPVLPALADHRKHRISVLAPLGMSMLGRRVGDTFEVKAPGGTREVAVEKILCRFDETDRGTSKKSHKQPSHDRANLPVTKH